MDVVDYSLLRRIQAKERSGAELAVLPEEFFSGVRDFVRGRGEKLEKTFDLSEAREFENSLKTLRDISDRRTHKILLKALRLKKYSGEETVGLALEEKKLFQSVVELLKQNEERVENILNRKEDAAGEKTVVSKRELKFVADVPCFVGLDLNNYGPFKTGERAVLPESEAELLLKKRMAETAGE
ncbi:DNA replication complex GINS family protein [Candidatus Micrarchaeota archaeon]|nr:DNA replication complex GINS family protein [Candidatus Micrarchaeota archaeon]